MTYRTDNELIGMERDYFETTKPLPLYPSEVMPVCGVKRNTMLSDPHIPVIGFIFCSLARSFMASSHSLVLVLGASGAVEC